MRLDGTNDKEGRELLAEANLPNVHMATTMHEAAEKVVELAKEACMSVLVDKDTKLCVSGITGREGTFHAMNNKRYGTNVVSGVTPGKGGQDVEGVPVFNTFHAAVDETGANTAMIFVPPPFAADSILEAADAGHRDDHRDHRGHPRPRRAARLQPPQVAPSRHAPDRPQLPRHPVAGQGERRDHPGRRSSRRATSASSRARAR